MKKGFFVIIALLLLGFTAQAQFKIGPSVGIPIGDLSDAYSLSWGIDTYYMLGDPNAFIKFGANASFLNFIGDEIDVLGQPVEFENLQFIPVSGVLRVTLFGFLTFGPDVGYAFSLGDEGEGTFYLKTVTGFDIANSVEINLFYQSISQESSLGTLGAGLLFEF